MINNAFLRYQPHHLDPAGLAPATSTILSDKQTQKQLPIEYLTPKVRSFVEPTNYSKLSSGRAAQLREIVHRR